jgi:signal transduction histidine kinase
MLSFVTDQRTWRALLFHGSSLAVGIAALAVLISGWTTAGVLAITPLIVPVLVGFGWAVHLLARAEAWLARELVGARSARAGDPPRMLGFWRTAGVVLTDRSFWTQQAYLVLRVLVGWPFAIAELALLAAGVGLLTAPVYYRWIPQDTGRNGIDVAVWRIDTLPKSLLVVPVGAALLLLGLALARPLGAVFARIADALLAPAAVERSPALGRRALAWHAAVTAGIGGLLCLIWAVTPHHAFWPVWALLPLAAVLAVHAWVRLLAERPAIWRRRGMTQPLAIHLGVATALFLMEVGFWAASGGGYFWPAWILLGLASSAALHWLVVLTRRAERLETTRAGAVDVQEADLRRIERDLHDGAQARLVALGMSLGLAEQKLDGDPEAARELVAEARAGVGEALAELRDLARGIRPPVLADRGLEAAVAALADRSPVPVDVSADVAPRPAGTVETAAYFVVAEALTNAAKHGSPTRVDVRLERRGDVLRVDVEDDGAGGADPDGGGLRGLRQRVEALDGSLSVTSPAGGPTVVHAELPCGS